MSIYVCAVGKSDLAPLAMPDRFRHEVNYFMTPPGEHGVPKLPDGEYWVRLDDARRWYDEGVIRLVSPLDSENQTEVELSEEQEAWMEWMLEHEVEHIRLSSK